MNWDELEKTWSAQKLPAWSAERLAEMEAGFAAQQRKLERTLFWRDLREAAAGVFVALVFARVGWYIGRHGWPIAVAVALMLALSGFFVRERWRARRRRPGAEAELLTRLNGEIAELERQEWLLTHVASWYLGPILAAAAIFGGTVLVNAPPPAPVKWVTGAMMVGVFAATSVFVVWLNRRAVQRTIAPRLLELREWRSALISSE